MPWSVRWRMVTLLNPPAGMLIVIAGVPLARMDEIQHPSMVIDLVMVTAPKPPGSRQSISPPAAVFEMAPANVLQGAVRLHGLASSPTPDTQVRLACACNIAVPSATIANKVTTLIFLILCFLSV